MLLRNYGWKPGEDFCRVRGPSGRVRSANPSLRSDYPALTIATTNQVPLPLMDKALSEKASGAQ